MSMSDQVSNDDLKSNADAYQEAMLSRVSRTFALTIPQLPAALRRIVGNAYLLCRIADTIEDEVTLTREQKRGFHNQFMSIVSGREEAGQFASAIYPLLSEHTLAAERELVRNAPRVVNLTHQFSKEQRIVIERCLNIMCQGMPEFQYHTGLGGLKDMRQLDRYCYYVAGVVGEMLTDLFCIYSPEIKKCRTSLMPLSISFGQGLQMTNILKDLWEDRANEVCWLPHELFLKEECDLHTLTSGGYNKGFDLGLERMIAIAHTHLHNALAYTLLIPSQEVGIRRFCLWAIGFAVLSLRKLRNTPGFSSSQQVKISRRSVKIVMMMANTAVRNDVILKLLFRWSAHGLPSGSLDPDWAPWEIMDVSSRD